MDLSFYCPLPLLILMKEKKGEFFWAVQNAHLGTILTEGKAACPLEALHLGERAAYKYSVYMWN